MEQIKELDFKIKEIAGRIKELREIENLSVADMAQKTGVTEEEYIDEYYDDEAEYDSIYYEVEVEYE